MNKIAIAFISCDRPEYFKQVLETVEKQTLSFNNFDVYLFQDLTNQKEKVDECVALFTKTFPSGNIVLRKENINVAMNYYLANKQLFFENDYTHIVYFADDMILSSYYLETLMMLIDKLGNDERIGAISCSGEGMLNSLEVQETNQHKLTFMGRMWGFCWTKAAYEKILPRLDEYLNKFIIGKDYRKRDNNGIRQWLRLNNFKNIVTSQDGVIDCALVEQNLIKISCFPGMIKHIGENGLHNNPGSYRNYRFGEQILYDKRIESIEDLTDEKCAELLRLFKSRFLIKF